MKDYTKFYIDGKWVDSTASRDFTVINPATEEPVARIFLGSADDVDRAVAAAKRAFASYSEVSAQDRLGLLRRIIDVYTSTRRSWKKWPRPFRRRWVLPSRCREKLKLLPVSPTCWKS